MYYYIYIKYVNKYSFIAITISILISILISTFTMENTDIPENLQDYTKTDINGLPARYVLAKHPSIPEGGYIVTKVIDIPSPDLSTTGVSESTHPTHSTHSRNPLRPPINPLYNFSNTPEHLQDQSKLVVQHRLGNHDLPHRRINPDLYTDAEKKWYITGILQQPIRAVMIYKLKCYCCGDFQAIEDDIHWEGTDVESRLGYKYCSNCKPYFRQALFNTLAPIWHLRLKYEKWREQNNLELERPFIWVHRTRRDAEGRRDVLGTSSYRYTKWCIINWVTTKYRMPHPSPDGTTIVEDTEDCITIEQLSEQIVDGGDYYSLTKLVSVIDVFIINQGMINDPDNYDPNIDDPLNKYTYEEKKRIVSEAHRSAVLY